MSHSGITYRATSDIRQNWAVFAGLVVALVIWCAVDVARRAILDPQRPALHMTDFTVYTEAGAAFFDGREPYEVTNIRGWKYLYPPLFALFVAPLAKLDPYWQAVVWFAVSSLMAFGCYFECRRLLSGFINAESSQDESELPRWLIVTVLLAAMFPAFNCLQRGQMGLALVYPLLLGFRLITLGLTRAALVAGGLVLALPIALKLTPALPAGSVLAVLLVAVTMRSRAGATDLSEDNAPESEFRDRQASGPVRADRSPGEQLFCSATGLMAGCLVFFLLLPAALLGWNDNLRHLHTWYVRVASRVNDVRDDDFGGDVASFRNQSLHNAVFRCGNWIAYQFFDGPDDLHMNVRRAGMPMDAAIVSHALTATRIAALVALGAVIVLAGRSSQPLLTGVAFGLAGVATLIVSPVSRGHYFVFWLPAVVFVPLWYRRIGQPRRALALAVIPAVLTLAHYALLKYAGRIGVLGLGTTAWYFATCFGIWSSRGAARKLTVQSAESVTSRAADSRAA